MQSSSCPEFIVCAAHIFSHWFHMGKKKICIWRGHWNVWGIKFTCHVKAIPLVCFLSSGIPSPVPYNLLVLLLLPHLVLRALYC